MILTGKSQSDSGNGLRIVAEHLIGGLDIFNEMYIKQVQFIDITVSNHASEEDFINTLVLNRLRTLTGSLLSLLYSMSVYEENERVKN